MLCQARGMFPDLGDGDVVEQRKEKPEVTVTSMLILDKEKAESGDYECTVMHEGGADKPYSLPMKK
ncbi:hypothetical protein M9458_004082, partial [Cirrhinus mrigala]